MYEIYKKYIYIYARPIHALHTNAQPKHHLVLRGVTAGIFIHYQGKFWNNMTGTVLYAN